MYKKSNEEYIEKLKILIESGDPASVTQAISLNDTLNLMSRKEISDILLLSVNDSSSWGNGVWDRIHETNNDWENFCVSLGGDSGPTIDEWMPANKTQGWETGDGFSNLDGYIPLPKATKGMNVAQYGKIVGEYVVGLEKKVMDWANSRPEIVRVENYVWGGQEVLGHDRWVGRVQISLEIDIDLVAYFE